MGNPWLMKNKVNALCFAFSWIQRTCGGEMGRRTLPAAGDDTALGGWTLTLFVPRVEISCLRL